MKVEFHERHALDILRFNVVNAVDVEEVIFVIVGNQPLHLLGVHTSIRLGNIEDRQIESRKDVYLHPAISQNAGKNDRCNKDHHSNRATEC